VYRGVPNGVGKTFLDFSIVHFKSFAGPMATPAGEFIFMTKPSSNLFVQSWIETCSLPTLPQLNSIE
jgi:hypothetical protein